MLRADFIQKSPKKTRARIAAIQKRIRNYREHENNYFDFHPEENEAVSALYLHAIEDIEFLLVQLNLSPIKQ
ncbi:MAG: hypothetical protein A3I24_03910 [Candidatus Harrisonbacteria bacterium RIFCSPLOWO2_02_FULL_41_13b]|uniref:Uncharacterized protein n=1 Tax=Candidatus Harrisonbacteria bacterium RIFCSPLOWO2_02_FULL_41_13b TaxID=1798409 RepID=A0A1G1ZQ45_9BACT|nr:MAG: hypothetical protein A3J53_00120 [Candidatus Harrisonbacteria bacterium RIFCSPHIGHO2_02_FULL_40_20]OGY66808.1 MAG: hypothetical protein A3I24_03910 [Candidatus Harrisonbacteria bacterium RIFCSPLOWO2_02_FULL_41_13b]